MLAFLLATLVQHPVDKHVMESRAATALYSSLNRERKAEGLPALEIDPLLSNAAVDHVVDMAKNHYFEHVSPAGISPWDRMRNFGCDFSYAGENIALAGSATQADRALYKSPPHRANILNGHYTRVGIAVMYDNDGRMLFVEDFAG
jgi:uncharacterized protein YkwD